MRSSCGPDDVGSWAPNLSSAELRRGPPRLLTRYAPVRSSVSLLLGGLGPNGLERHDGDWLQHDGPVLEVNLEERLTAESQSAPRIRRKGDPAGRIHGNYASHAPRSIRLMAVPANCPFGATPFPAPSSKSPNSMTWSSRNMAAWPIRRQRLRRPAGPPSPSRPGLDRPRASWSSCTPGDRPTSTRAVLPADAGGRSRHEVRPIPPGRGRLPRGAAPRRHPSRRRGPSCPTCSQGKGTEPPANRAAARPGASVLGEQPGIDLDLLGHVVHRRIRHVARVAGEADVQLEVLQQQREAEPRPARLVAHPGPVVAEQRPVGDQILGVPLPPYAALPPRGDGNEDARPATRTSTPLPSDQMSAKGTPTLRLRTRTRAPGQAGGVGPGGGTSPAGAAAEPAVDGLDDPAVEAAPNNRGGRILQSQRKMLHEWRRLFLHPSSRSLRGARTGRTMPAWSRRRHNVR
jgi:hypothetical protein